MKLFSVVFLLLATSANAFVVTPAAVKAPAASSFTAAVPRAVAPNMGILPETNAPDGNGGYKKVDPVELTPQFILLGTIIFIFDYCKYHPL